MDKKRLMIPVIILVAGLLVWAIYKDQTLTSEITLEMTPSSGSNISLNERGVREGISKVRPGTYTIRFTREGFEPVSKALKLSKGERQYVGVVLVSNSQDTANWYQKNQADQKKAEGISSRNSDQLSINQQKSLPLIKELPFIDRLYKVDYGRSERQPSDPKILALYIRHFGEEGKKQALEWLVFKGYKPSELEIIYHDSSIN